MRTRLFRLVVLLSTSLIVWSGPAAAQFYAQHNLVSDGFVASDHPDGHLVNPWGLVASATSPWWVANNGTGTATLYDGHGVARAIVVSIPGGVPTGTVFNGGVGFVVRSINPSGACLFNYMVATENGVIAGW